MIPQKEAFVLEGRIRGRLELCEEINNFLLSNRSFFGFIRWWRLNAVLKRWIVENDDLLSRHRGYL